MKTQKDNNTWAKTIENMEPSTFVRIAVWLKVVLITLTDLGLLCRYRLQTVKSLAGVSLMLRLLWACLRWDDMAVKPSPAVGTTRTGECPASLPSSPSLCPPHSCLSI